MAGSPYRGLTIRIGADTTGLVSSLNSVTRQANTAQQAMRRLQQASRLNGGQLGLNDMGQYARNAADRVRLLETQVARYAAGSRQAAEATGQWRGQLVAIGDAEKILNGSDLAGAVERFNSLDNSLANLKDRLQEFYEGSELAREGEEKLFDNEDIEAYLDSLSQISPEVRKLVENYRSLRSEWGMAFEDAKTAKAVNGYRDLQSVMSKTRAEARKLANEMVDERATTYLQRQNTAYRAMQDTVDSLTSRIRQMDRALELDPSNKAAAAERLRLLSDAAAVAGREVNVLKARLESISTDRVRQLADLGGDTATSFRQARESARAATEEYEAQAGAVRELKQRINELQNQLKSGVAKGSDNSIRTMTGADVQSVKGQLDKLQAELSQTEAKAKAAQKAMQSSMSDLDSAKAVEEYRQLKEEIAKAEAQAENFRTQGLKTGVSFASVGNQIKAAGWSAYSTLTPLAMMAGYSIVQSADDIDSAYRNMRKTVNGTEEQFDALKDAAERFSTTHWTSASDLLNIEAIGGQLGIAVDGLDSFSEAVANLNIATNITDAEQMATWLGQLGNITHMTSDQYGQFADALVRLGNNTPALESNIMDVATRIGSMGTISGFTVPQILAISDAVAATGQGSEAAGTAIAKSFSDIEQAVGAGGDKLQGFADVAGMSADEFSDAWQNKPMEAFTAFINGLKRISDEGGSVDNTLTNLGIGSVRQRQALEGLTQTTDVLAAATQMADDAWGGISDTWGDAGDAEREATRKTEGFSGALKKLQNSLQVMGQALGEGLAGPMSALADIVSQLANAFDGAPDGVKQFAAALGILAVASGPVLVGLGSVLEQMQNISVYSKAMNTALANAARGGVTKAKALGTAIRAMALSAMSGSGAMGTLADGVSAAQVSMGKVGTGASKVASAMKALKFAAAGAGIALGVVAAVMVGMAIARYIEKMQKAQKATSGMASTAAGWTRSLNEQAEAIRGTTGYIEGWAAVNAKSLSEVRSEVDQLNDSGASMVDSWKQRQSELAGNIGMAENALDRIIQLQKQAADAGGLNAGQQAALASAVEQYNTATGSSISVTDAVTGKLSESTDELKKNTEEWKKNAKMQALSSMMQDAYKQQYDAAQKLADAQNTLNTAQATYDDYKRRGIDVSKEAEPALRDAQKAVDDAQASYESATGAISDFNEQMAGTQENLDDNAMAIMGAIQASDGWATAVRDANIDMAAFSQSMEDAGFSAQNMASLSSSQMQYLASSYDGSAESIQNTMTNMQGITSHQFDVIWQNCHGDISKVNEALDGVKDHPATVFWQEVGYSEVDGHLRGIMDRLSKTIVATVQYVVAGANARGGFLASGGIVSNAVPLHADGGIFTRAVVSTGGVYGEDGAEAVVPLTNRQYSRPFARTIAEEQVDLLRGNVGVDYEQMADAMELALGRVQLRPMVYIDGRKVSRALGSHMDSDLGYMGAISQRGLR